MITGKTPQAERERLFQAFQEGRLNTLILSKVGNFALDLPDAVVLVQVSGAFGSRQEEAQRLGRLLRPKQGGRGAHFYTLVTRETSEEDFAHHRQLFGCSPAEVLMVGDSFSADIAGARAAGVQAAWLRRNGGEGDLKSLKELATLL